MGEDHTAVTAEKIEPRAVYYLENIEQLQAISDPIRYAMLIKMTAEARTGAQLARLMGMSRARAHYHLKLLERVGLVRFCGEGVVSGLTEKYYRAVGRMFDFTRLIPKADQDSLPNETSLAMFKTIGDFILTLLDASRESLLRSDGGAILGTGFFFDFTSVLTPAQYEAVKEDLRQIKNRILENTQENEKGQAEGGTSSGLVEFRTTFFLTQLHKEGDDVPETHPE